MNPVIQNGFKIGLILRVGVLKEIEGKGPSLDKLVNSLSDKGLSPKTPTGFSLPKPQY